MTIPSGNEHRGARGLSRLERTVRVGGVGERELLLRFAVDAPGQHVPEQLVGHRQHVRAGRGVVDHRRSRDQMEPLTASSVVSITTGPDVVPLLTSVPRGWRLSSEAISVSLPTES